MVLKASPGDTIERYIRVINANNESVTINITATGNLSENVKLKDNNFILKQGEEKKAYFTIKADKEGTTETNLNVAFIPEKGNNVGLVATVILIAGTGQNNSDSTSSDNIEDNETANQTAVTVAPAENKNIKSKISDIIPKTNLNITSSGALAISPYTLVLVLPTVLLVILLILIFYASRKIKQKKRAKGYV